MILPFLFKAYGNVPQFIFTKSNKLKLIMINLTVIILQWSVKYSLSSNYIRDNDNTLFSTPIIIIINFVCIAMALMIISPLEI